MASGSRTSETPIDTIAGVVANAVRRGLSTEVVNQDNNGEEGIELMKIVFTVLLGTLPLPTCHLEKCWA